MYVEDARINAKSDIYKPNWHVSTFYHKYEIDTDKEMDIVERKLERNKSQ
jgi:hypothetical protein